MSKKYQSLLVATCLCVGLLTACETQTVSKSEIQEGQNTTTVIENADVVKPQKGAVISTQVLRNFWAYDWTDSEHVIGYQYASSIFGDDRGLQIKSLADGTLKTIAFEGLPAIANLSKDKQKLFVIKEGSGRSKPFYVVNLVDQSAKSYALEGFAYYWHFNWFKDGTGVAVSPQDASHYQLLTLDSSGKATTDTLTYTPSKKQGEIYMSIGDSLAKRDQNLYFMVYSDDAGVYQKNLTTSQVKRVLSLENIGQLSIPDAGNVMAVASYNTNGTESKLSVYSLSGSWLYDIHSALNFMNLVWSDDGRKLVFTATEATGETSLYLSNLESGQTHFLGTYPGYSIMNLAFSPDGKSLLLAYKNKLGDALETDSQVLKLE